jgi:hypothetical protein
MPRIFKEIIQRRRDDIMIVSARTMFEEQMPSKFYIPYHPLDRFREWKLMAFLEFIDLNRDPVTNILAIGDS